MVTELCTKTYIVHPLLEPLDLGLYQYSTWHQSSPKEYIKVRGQRHAQIPKLWAARRAASGKIWSGKYMVSELQTSVVIHNENVGLCLGL